MKGRRRPSLSRRLLVGLVVASAAWWCAITWLTVRDAVNQVYELFDAHLAQTALALLRVTDPDDSDPVSIPRGAADAPPLTEIFARLPHLPERIAGIGGGAAPVVAGTTRALNEDYERHLRYQVFTGNGVLLLRSANAPEAAMATQDGYSEATDADGRVWRHFAVWDQHHDFRILVSEAHDLRNSVVRNIALQMVGPLALGLPVLIVLLWYFIGRGLNPLGALTREIEVRKADNLTPLDAGDAPREVRPMVLALNKLLQRVTQSLDGERRFTANAAHELRTPLAAIQANLHVVRHAEDDAERRRALDLLEQGVERGTRLVGQLLTLARLDPEQALPDIQAVDVAAVAEAVCAERAPLALERDQQLELQVEPGLPPVAGQVDLLSMLFSNLVDNAIRYTQRGGHIAVSVHRSGAAVCFDVLDDGPGIPAPQRERVFDRFVRLPGNDEPGTGLGLAICRRIAELHAARLTLGDAPQGRGLRAGVVMPTDRP